MNTGYIPPTFARHLKTEPPDTLYHYTGQVGLLGIIQNAELWATKVQYMNDLAEFRRALSMAQTGLDLMISNSSNDSSRQTAGVQETPQLTEWARRHQHLCGVLL